MTSKANTIAKGIIEANISNYSDKEVKQAYIMMARFWNAFEGDAPIMEQAINTLETVLISRNINIQETLKNI